ncbi:MAG: TrmO family methyltransferase domain-containing protein [Candidatus Thorarchaeota archaeon]|jgi:tRNA-Thr(GGU) m(6)t(6)A37 methyltransferase TsaA
MKFTIQSVGFVRKLEEGKILLDIESEFWDGTLHINTFSHIHVIWWATGLDTPEDRRHLQGCPPYEGAPLSGVFASRSPMRPNLLCLSIVRIIQVDEGGKTIEIDQIDAMDGTPIVDIKPYLPSSDRVDDAIVPEWTKNLENRYTK